MCGSCLHSSKVDVIDAQIFLHILSNKSDQGNLALIYAFLSIHVFDRDEGDSDMATYSCSVRMTC